MSCLRSISIASLVGLGLGAGLSLALVACQARERAAPAPAPASQLPPVSTAATAAVPFAAEPPLGCATLRDVAVSDIVRVEGKTLFYADSTAGLTIVDASEAARPRVLSVVPFVGTPLALFVREGLAWVVFVDPDSRSGKAGLATVIRAVDVRDPSHPRVVGEEVRAGTARDAELVGGLLYVMRSVKDHTVVEELGVQGTKLHVLDSVDLKGAPAQLAASAAGLAAVTNEGDHVRVAWIDLSMERPGSMVVRSSVTVPGGVASWERGDGRIVDADEGQRVRIVTCATRSCTPGDPATLRIVDFSTEAPSRSMTSLRLTEHDGLPTTRFADGVLYVADVPATDAETTTLHVVLTDERTPRFAAHLPLRGRISALVPRSGALVALGSTGSTDTQMKLIVHDVDVQRATAPRARSTIVFGSDWTWSIVADEAEAMSFDPASNLLAVPFTAWRHEDKRYVTGAQLVDLQPPGARAGAALPASGWVERAVFLEGYLVTFGPNGVASIDYGAAHLPDTSERPLELGR